jgi:hypothetical protein
MFENLYGKPERSWGIAPSASGIAIEPLLSRFRADCNAKAIFLPVQFADPE